MAVIHLNDRITNRSDNFERYKRSSESLIYFDSQGTESFSIDFSVGTRWAEYTGQGDLPHLYDIENGRIQINSKQSVLVETKEKIMMPHNLFGIIMPTGRLFLNNGIMCNTAKIEPGYEDKLFLLLYNTSNSKKEIEIGDKIATAIFFSTEETPASVPRITRDILHQQRPYNWFKRFCDSIKNNYGNNPYVFVLDIFKLILTFIAGATFAKYFMA